jgi:LacI family transcriptional regulator
MSRSLLGILTNDPAPIFQSSVIRGADNEAQRHGYQTVVIPVTPIVEDVSALLPEMAALRGIVVIANVLSDSALTQVVEAGIAVSLVSHHSPTLPSVVSNNQQGIALLMEHLVVHCGRRIPLFVRGNRAQMDAIEREYAFQQELLRYNLTQHYTIEGEFSARRATQAMRDFLVHMPKPEFDCVLSADYLTALAVVDVLREAGCRVPEEIAVTGFGDGAIAAAAGLTTVGTDVVALGQRGTRQLIHQIEGLRIQGHTVLRATLEVRQTTCL